MFSVKPTPWGTQVCGRPEFSPREEDSRFNKERRETLMENKACSHPGRSLRGLAPCTDLTPSRGPALPACWGQSPLRASKAWLDLT